MRKIKYILPWMCIAIISILSSYFFSYYLPNKRSVSIEKKQNTDIYWKTKECENLASKDYFKEEEFWKSQKTVKFFKINWDRVGYNVEQEKCFYAYFVEIMPENSTSYNYYNIVDATSKETVLSIFDTSNPGAKAQYLTLRYLLLRK